MDADDLTTIAAYIARCRNHGQTNGPQWMADDGEKALAIAQRIKRGNQQPTFWTTYRPREKEEPGPDFRAL